MSIFIHGIISGMYTIDKLSDFNGLKHSFSTTEEGNMSFKFDEEEIVNKHRKAFLDKLEISPNDSMAPQLVHGSEVMKVTKLDTGKGILDWRTSPKADALITDQRNVYFFMLIGDCLPVILYDKKKNVLGLAHAGWKGVEKRIVQNTVQEMQGNYDVKPEDMLAAIGPCIRKESYRFETVVQREPERTHAWKDYLTDNDDDTTSVDLVGFVNDQLTEVGVHEIIDSNVDTGIDKRFFSHYRDSRSPDGDRGRFACVVGMS